MANFGMNQFDAQARIRRGRDEARARIDRGRNQARGRIGRGGESWTPPPANWKGRWGGFANIPQAAPAPGGAPPGAASRFFPKAFAKHGHGPLGPGTGDTTMASLNKEQQSEQMEGRRNVFGGIGEIKLPPGFFTGKSQTTPLSPTDPRYSDPDQTLLSAQEGGFGAPLGSPGTYVGGQGEGIPGIGELNFRGSPYFQTDRGKRSRGEDLGFFDQYLGGTYSNPQGGFFQDFEPYEIDELGPMGINHPGFRG